MLKDVSSRSWDELGGGGITRFGGGSTPKSGEVIDNSFIHQDWCCRSRSPTLSRAITSTTSGRYGIFVGFFKNLDQFRLGFRFPSLVIPPLELRVSFQQQYRFYSLRLCTESPERRWDLFSFNSSFDLCITFLCLLVSSLFSLWITWRQVIYSHGEKRVSHLSH